MWSVLAAARPEVRIGYFGKINLQADAGASNADWRADIAARGIDEFDGYRAASLGVHDNWARQRFTAVGGVIQTESENTELTWSDDRFVESALEFMGDAIAAGEPYFVVVSFDGAHTPSEQPPGKSCSGNYDCFNATVEYVSDHSVTLREAQGPDDFFIWSSDNGTVYPGGVLSTHPADVGKFSSDDTGSVVPFFVVGPGVPVGTAGDLASGVDLTPTILDLMGVQPISYPTSLADVDIAEDPESLYNGQRFGMDGRSLRGLLIPGSCTGSPDCWGPNDRQEFVYSTFFPGDSTGFRTGKSLTHKAEFDETSTTYDSCYACVAGVCDESVDIGSDAGCDAIESWLVGIEASGP